MSAAPKRKKFKAYGEAAPVESPPPAPARQVTAHLPSGYHLPQEEVERLLASWRELNVFLARCDSSRSLAPLLIYAHETRCRFPVVERIWQRLRALEGREERDSLRRFGILPPRYKELYS